MLTKSNQHARFTTDFRGSADDVVRRGVLGADHEGGHHAMSTAAHNREQ